MDSREIIEQSFGKDVFIHLNPSIVEVLKRCTVLTYTTFYDEASAVVELHLKMLDLVRNLISNIKIRKVVHYNKHQGEYETSLVSKI